MTDNAAQDLSGSIGSLSEEDIVDEDALQGDNWIEELECALLADCDPQTLKKICEGKRIPDSLRPDYWRTLLSLNDIGNIRLTNEFDLPNQLKIRQDCETVVEQIAHNQTNSNTALSDAVKLKLRSDFERTITTYVKARPEVEYVSGNGWTEILRVLQNLDLDGSQMYQMFFRIVDRYIPKNLVPKQSKTPAQDDKNISRNVDQVEKSAQAYHLMRLLIQYHDPELCSILESKKVSPCAYVRDWFTTLFAQSCPTQLALHIWDTHFKMADPLLIFFAAIVMVVNAGDELKKAKLTQAEMLEVLKSMPSKLELDDIEDLYYLVSNHYTNSTPRSVRSYSHLFFMDTFANTYRGSESPEEGQRLLDLKTTQLISSIDLSQYLCLPIVPAEIFAQDNSSSTAQQSSPTHTVNSPLRYFLVDCRPAEQYNAGHLAKAFHLDCSLMLREPSSFALSVQALLEIQKQVVSSKSNTGGQHLCFIGSGQDEEDRYVNMVIASFLQKYQKYVSIAHGGFDAIHDYVKAKCDLDVTFNKFVVDHDEKQCKACLTKLPDGLDKWKSSRPSVSQSTTSVGSLLASTTSFLRGDKSYSSNALSKLAQSNPQTAATANMIAQSSISMFDKFTTAFVTKSNVFKDKLVESLNQTNATSETLTQSLAQPARSHVSEQDKLGRRYTGSSLVGNYVSDINDDDLKAAKTHVGAVEEPCREIQIDVWQKEEQIIALHKCCQIKGPTRYPGWIGLSQTYLWILREIPHNKGFASVAAKRPLNMIVQITSKRRQPDCIIFRYGHAQKPPGVGSPSQAPQSEPAEKAGSQQTKNLPTVIASDNVQIPQPFDMLRLIKNEIIRIMDETAKAAARQAGASNKQEATSTVTSDPSAERRTTDWSSGVAIKPADAESAAAAAAAETGSSLPEPEAAEKDKAAAVGSGSGNDKREHEPDEAVEPNTDKDAANTRLQEAESKH